MNSSSVTVNWTVTTRRAQRRRVIRLDGTQLINNNYIESTQRGGDQWIVRYVPLLKSSAFCIGMNIDRRIGLPECLVLSPTLKSLVVFTQGQFRTTLWCTHMYSGQDSEMSGSGGKTCGGSLCWREGQLHISFLPHYLPIQHEWLKVGSSIWKSLFEWLNRHNNQVPSRHDLQ